MLLLFLLRYCEGRPAVPQQSRLHQVVPNRGRPEKSSALLGEKRPTSQMAGLKRAILLLYLLEFFSQGASLILSSNRWYSARELLIARSLQVSRLMLLPNLAYSATLSCVMSSFVFSSLDSRSSTSSSIFDEASPNISRACGCRTWKKASPILYLQSRVASVSAKIWRRAGAWEGKGM